MTTDTQARRTKLEHELSYRYELNSTGQPLPTAASRALGRWVAEAVEDKAECNRRQKVAREEVRRRFVAADRCKWDARAKRQMLAENRGLDSDERRTVERAATQLSPPPAPKPRPVLAPAAAKLEGERREREAQSALIGNACDYAAGLQAPQREATPPPESPINEIAKRAASSTPRPMPAPSTEDETATRELVAAVTRYVTPGDALARREEPVEKRRDDPVGRAIEHGAAWLRMRGA